MNYFKLWKFNRENYLHLRNLFFSKTLRKLSALQISPVALSSSAHSYSYLGLLCRLQQPEQEAFCKCPCCVAFFCDPRKWLCCLCSYPASAHFLTNSPHKKINVRKNKVLGSCWRLDCVCFLQFQLQVWFFSNIFNSSSSYTEK